MPFSLIMEYSRAGSNFLTFSHYLQICNTHEGFMGGDFYCVCGFGFGFGFFNGQVAIRSLPVFAT